MKSRTFVCVAALAALGFGSAVQAQPDHQSRGEAQAPREHQQQQQHQWGGQRSQGQQQWRQQYGQQSQYRQGYQQQFAAPQNRGYSGYNNYAAPRYYAGGYAPAHRFLIRDWRERNLYAPPYGYGWVQTDAGDVLLVALASGLIASAILAQ